MPLDIGQHSLTLLKGIEEAIDVLENLGFKYESLIEQVDTEFKYSQPINAAKTGYTPYFITFIPVNKSLQFYFELRGVKDLGNGKTEYLTAFKPKSAAATDEYMGDGALNMLSSRFEAWVELIKGYNSVRLSRKDKFAAESAEQFYADFELVDEDANTAPFNNDKQVLVYKLLEFIKETVEQVEDGDKEEADVIVRQIESLQHIIPSVTKAAVIKELSKVYAKVKAYSMKAFVAVYDVAKKELIKHYLYETMDGVDAFIKTFHLPHH